MKKISVILSVLLCLGFTAIMWLAKARVPHAWQTLQVGDTIAEVKVKIPGLVVCKKDGGMNQCFHANQQVNRFGVLYRWTIDLTFDNRGQLKYVDARSYNDLTSLLDSEFKTVTLTICDPTP